MNEWFRRFANTTSTCAGSSWAFLLAVGMIGIWAVAGPLFLFSETWQLVINTATTIVTFLMVFLIQNTQNRDAMAIHLKLDELIKGVKGARTQMVSLENLSDQELAKLREEFDRIHAQEKAKGDSDEEAKLDAEVTTGVKVEALHGVLEKRQQQKKGVEVEPETPEPAPGEHKSGNGKNARASSIVDDIKIASTELPYANEPNPGLHKINAKLGTTLSKLELDRPEPSRPAEPLLATEAVKKKRKPAAAKAISTDAKPAKKKAAPKPAAKKPAK